MAAQSLKIYGYALSLLPMLLFVLGASIGAPWIVVVFFFVVLPVVRLFLNDDPAAPPDIDQVTTRQFRWLAVVPWLQVGLWALVLPWSMFMLRNLPSSQLPGFVLALWVVVSLNLPVVHEMLHSRQRRDRVAARIMAGSIGYFQLLDEHKSHHGSNGVAVGDSAEVGQNLYAYAAKRFMRSFSVAQRWEAQKQVRRGRSHWNNRLTLTALLTIAVVASFGLVAGWRGVVVYAILILGAAFSFQAITYIQHWGLTEHAAPDLAGVGYSWEDRCWMQACITLNIAYHGHHHLRPSLPYYQLVGLDRAPRLPASYPVMFLAALVPPLFDKAMKRRLDAWLVDKGAAARPRSRACANPAEFLSA